MNATTPTWHATSPIGIDLGTRCVKLAQLRRGRGGALAIEAAAAALPREAEGDWRRHPDAAVDVIRRLLKSGRFTGRHAVAAVPGDLVEYRTLRIGPTANLTGVIHARVASQLSLAEDRYESRLFDAGEVWEHDERRREVVAMAAPHDGLLALLDLLQRCGLVPLALDAPPAAATRGVAGVADSTLVVANVGYSTTTVTIEHEGRIRFVRRLETSVRAIDEDLAAALEIAPEQAEGVRDALRDETDEPTIAGVPRAGAAVALTAAAERHGKTLAAAIAKCLQYYGVTFRAGRPAAGVVLGGGAGEPALVETLRRNTGVSFRTVDDSEATAWAVSGEPAGSLVALAAGLARRGDAELAVGAAA